MAVVESDQPARLFLSGPESLINVRRAVQHAGLYLGHEVIIEDPTGDPTWRCQTCKPIIN